MPLGDDRAADRFHAQVDRGDTEVNRLGGAVAVLFDGQADFLFPDGTHVLAAVHAGQRGGRWAGTVRVPESNRRLERGDICRLTHDRFEGELRVVITEQTGSHRYAFIGLVKPDPWETL